MLLKNRDDQLPLRLHSSCVVRILISVVNVVLIPFSFILQLQIPSCLLLMVLVVLVVLIVLMVLKVWMLLLILVVLMVLVVLLIPLVVPLIWSGLQDCELNVFFFQLGPSGVTTANQQSPSPSFLCILFPHTLHFPVLSTDVSSLIFLLTSCLRFHLQHPSANCPSFVTIQTNVLHLFSTVSIALER